MIALARSIGIKAQYGHAVSGEGGHVFGRYKVDGNWFICDTGRINDSWGTYCKDYGPADSWTDSIDF